MCWRWKILRFVRHSLNSRRVNLLSVTGAANMTGEHELSVDESLSEFTVSVSGHRPVVNVTDPAGLPVTGPPKLHPLVNLENVTVVNIQEPDPGSWRVKVTSDSGHVIRSTGVSNVDFITKFSTLVTSDMDEASHRPLKGQNTSVLIQPTQAGDLHNLTLLRLVSLEGEVLKEIPLRPVAESPGLHRGEPFFPPYEINGFDKDGFPIKRISPTAISGQDPALPIVTMRPRTSGWINEPVTLRCHVEILGTLQGHVVQGCEPHQRFHHVSSPGDLGSIPDLTMTTAVVPNLLPVIQPFRALDLTNLRLPTSKVLWHFKNPTENLDGNYTCWARNLAGIGRKVTYLYITGPPPKVETSPQVLSAPNKKAYLHCFIRSTLEHNVTWARTKTIQQHSSGGQNDGLVYLAVREAIEVTVTPEKVDFQRGDTFTLSCHAKGTPKPNITWKKDRRKILVRGSIGEDMLDGRVSQVARENGSDLVVEKAGIEDEGVYQCEAENDMDLDVGVSETRFVEPPMVTAEVGNKLVKAGDTITLKCLISGIPEPAVTWSRRGQEILPDFRLQFQNDTSLKIVNVEMSDAGEYTCIGQNKVGTSHDSVSLDVGMSPRIVQVPMDVEIKYNSNGSVPCMALGLPAPDISWFREDGKILEAPHFTLLDSGSLLLTDARIDDQGTYVCKVENKFGTVELKADIKITGFAAPVLDDSSLGTELTLVHGQSAVLPCRVLVGDPAPSVSWYKDGELLSKEEIQWPGVVVTEDGSLLVNYATGELEGEYSCMAANVAGNDEQEHTPHRDGYVWTDNSHYCGGTESCHGQQWLAFGLKPPSFLVGNRSESPVYKVMGGDSVVIPCDVQGEPKPMINWQKDRMPLLPSSNVFKDPADNSLVIRNASEGDTGSYVCTAVNSAGTENKAAALFVRVPPRIEPGPVTLTALEGEIVTLYCEVKAVPPAEVSWFKNDEPVSSPRHEVSMMDNRARLRFVANFSDNGRYKCMAANEVGSDFREVFLSVIVSPSIYPPDDEFVKANVSQELMLNCHVSGYPFPKVKWEKNGVPVRNDSNLSITEESILTIKSVQPESAGVYICDVENKAGITQKSFYIIVHTPPRIREDLPSYVQVMEGEDYALPCSAEGIPEPIISWKKEDQAIVGEHQDDLAVLGDGTLIITSATVNTTAIYTCVAENIDGLDQKHYVVEVMIPPSMTEMEATKLEVVEGDPVIFSCPAIDAIPAPKFTWLKESGPLNYQTNRRSDEAHFILKDSGRTLKIEEASSVDAGNYSCVASNQAGQTEASFLLDVLLLPFFEEFRYQQQISVVEGRSLRLDCSATGNPTPRLSWRKNKVPVTVHTSPGVLLSANSQTLSIPQVRPHDSGIYHCAADSKVGRIERDYHVKVFVPPHIDGPTKEPQEVVEGEPLLLQCPIVGTPEPIIRWWKDGHTLEINEDQDMILSDDKKILELSSTEKYDEGVYMCMGNNPAGSQTKLFNVTVLEPPVITQEHFLEEVKVREGASTELTCRVRGFPTPEVTWLHNGRIVDHGAALVDTNTVAGTGQTTQEHVLALDRLGVGQGGKYTCLASNQVGVAEKNFRLKILVAPKLSENRDHSNTIESLEGLPITIKCPVVGNPVPDIHWMKDDRPLDHEPLLEEADGQMLHISNSRVEHSGNYTCVAQNYAGNISQSFQLDVMAPPAMADGEEEETDFTLKTGDTLRLDCNVTGHPPPDIVWLKGAAPVTRQEWLHPQLLEHGRILTIPGVTTQHSGQYSCLAINMAGTTEMTFNVEVQEPPHVENPAESSTNQSVKLHRRLALRCPIVGVPQPKITWFKAFVQNSGEYSCLAENSAGSDEVFFYVTVEVPVEWSAWSPWSDCSTTCGPGDQTRVRVCEGGTGPDSVDPDDCQGESQQAQTCHMSVCQIDGGWSEWSDWTSCSETCGRATRRRYRKCDSPTPAYEGRPCLGSDGQQEYCHQSPCPIHGNWSEWSGWSDCTAPCDEGTKYRVRECTNPAPAYGGDNCEGPNMETTSCNAHRCPVDGNWSPWGDWSTCSVSCGPGYRRRYRTCTNPEPQFRGAPCDGENLQVEKCSGINCNQVPQGATLRLNGRLNGERIDDIIAANIEDRGQKRFVMAKLNDILKHKASWFPYLPFMLSPVLWNTAKEEEEANNGYSLTQGNFHESQLLEFVSGEELVLTHTGRGVDQEGTLQVDIQVDGAVPIIQPKSSIYIAPYQGDLATCTLYHMKQARCGDLKGSEGGYVPCLNLQEDYVQTGPNTLYASSTNALTVNGRQLPYSWNNTVQYDTMQGTMPFLVERLSAEDIGMQYDPDLEEMKYMISTVIGRKFDDNRCPEGFVLDEKHLHCRDLNECRDKQNNKCHFTQVCENVFGSYRCNCRKGFRSEEAGKRCIASQPGDNLSNATEPLRRRFQMRNLPTLRDDQSSSKSSYYHDASPQKWPPESYRCPDGFQEVAGIVVGRKIVNSMFMLESKITVFISSVVNISDIDECELAQHVCNLEQTCLNLRGRYKCLDTPCPGGYERDIDTGIYSSLICQEDTAIKGWPIPFKMVIDTVSGEKLSLSLLRSRKRCSCGSDAMHGHESRESCTTEDSLSRECRTFDKNCNQFCDESGVVCHEGAQLMQTVIYTSLTPDLRTAQAYQDLMVLAVTGEDGHKLPRTRFRIVDNEIGGGSFNF
uniref:Hemicentin-1 n=1 Tax=Timema bartmani TaxID=61472 RepID=A0A7R9EVN9_9NEOP|nr:unnamed protein product [Timema bartmani]